MNSFALPESVKENAQIRRIMQWKMQEKRSRALPEVCFSWEEGERNAFYPRTASRFFPTAAATTHNFPFPFVILCYPALTGKGQGKSAVRGAVQGGALLRCRWHRKDARLYKTPRAALFAG